MACHLKKLKSYIEEIFNNNLLFILVKVEFFSIVKSEQKVIFTSIIKNTAISISI